MGDTRSWWLAAAELYIAECEAHASSVRASEFASRMQRTPVQLVREFRQSVGFCVKAYFSSRQIARAAELLRTTRRTTADIALRAGFGTARSFFRAFRRSTGMSPAEFRKQMSLGRQ
jgi:AraC-like DNA-binding protein